MNPTWPPRLLLVGPTPPPHGGISVHVATARDLLRLAGARCRVLDSGGHRSRGGAWATLASVARLLRRIDVHARRGYTLHLHTNGHSVASWCMALACAATARRAPGRVLTLHSGLLPEFLERGGALARGLERATLARYDRVICVNQRIHDALLAHGSDPERLAILPAHLVTPPRATTLPSSVASWVASRSPIVSSALFFRPEYGFDLLLDAVARLAARQPRLGCVVMGGGAAAGADSGWTAARRRVDELGLGERVLLTGDLPHRVCLAVMARSDVFARPALADGDAISVREALALGLPVVASDAVERPAGATLHRSGDASDLAARLDQVLATARDGAASSPTRAADAERGFDALLWIYREARAGRSAAATTRRGRLASCAARLRVMSAREVGERLRQALHARADRLIGTASREESHRSLLEGCGARNGSLLRHLEATVAPRFYLPAPPAERRAVAELLWRRFPSWLSAAAAEAERLCQHRVDLLGYGEVELGADIDWHRDPVSGTVWPRRHFSSYDPVREPDADAKRVCELNRHQHLPRLGKAYFLLGEERYAREAVAQMLSWIEQNPRGIGLHWHSSLELAIRALSWLWTLFYVLPSAALDEAAALRICKSLYAQLDHVARYLSLYGSPNTHLLGEATALYVGGLLFRDGPRGRRWLELGGALLDREAERQVLDDGVHAELSPYYHCYAADFYLQALALARRCGRPVEPRVWRGVERMFDALAHLAGPDLKLPLLGDDDGGRVLALGSTTHYGDAGDLLCAGAALFHRGDWKRRAGAFYEEAFWLLGEEGLKAWETLPVTAPATLRRSFDAAGYVVERTGWARTSAQLVFDRGDLGSLGGGHGHADALSIVLSASGEQLLVDSGTGVYNAAPEWRAFFRSTRAHNTLVVDDAEQSAPADTFRWTRQARTRALGDGSYPGIHYAAGEHDGYAATLGLTHRRRVLSIEDGYWLVLDDVRRADAGAGGDPRGGGGRHGLELLWHFAPGAEVSLLNPATVIAPAAARGAVGNAAGAAAKSVGMTAVARVGSVGLALRLLASAPITGRLVCGATAPPQGWVSRRYGEMRPAPVLETRWISRVPAVCATILSLCREARQPGAATAPDRGAAVAAGARAVPVRVVDAVERGATAIAFVIPHARGEDLVVLASAGALVEAGPCRARAEVLWLRLEDDRPALLLALDASSVKLRGERMLTSTQPVHHFWSAAAARAAAPHRIEESLHVRHRRDR
ncbi:MAG TPA: heparinase II/III family protein [Thermoanaerobaculia bacterium]|nr:heparinase II/III family protein [Thermoanaerobaculia bacterium]